VQKPSKTLEIISTGIRGLDRILLGGYPRGALILLAGNPGTGKSTMAAKFLYEGGLAGEKGIYVNFVEPKKDFLVHMAMLGMDFTELEEKGLFEYIEALTIVDEDALVAQLEDILRRIVETGAKRLVIDSVTAMLQIVKDKAKIRELVQNFFVNGVKQMDVTTILIAEHPYGAKMVGYGIEEFIVDAVMILRFEIVQGKIRRILELRKARWAPIRQAEIPFYIRPGIVVELSLPEAPQEVPALDLSSRYNLAKALLDLNKAARGELLGNNTCRLHVGEEGVYVIPRGAQIVVGHTPTLDAKHLISLLTAALLVSYKPRIALFSFKSSPIALRRLIGCLLSIGCGRECTNELLSNVYVESVNPTAFTFTEIYDIMRQFVEAVKPDILFVEGMDIIEQFVQRNEYLEMLYNLMLSNKRERVTSFYTFSARDAEAIYNRMAASMADVMIYVEEPHTIMGEAASIKQSYIVEFAGFFGRVERKISLNVELLYKHRCIS